jgi:hypothetical protein
MMAFAALLAVSCQTGDDDDDQVAGDDDNDDNDDNNDTADDDNDDNDNNDTDDDDDDDDDDNDNDTPLDCPAVITRQPYLQLMTQTSVHVLWRTDQPGDSVVEWGPTAALGEQVRREDLTKRHELAIKNLEPGTTYYYKARSCLDETTVASFRTAPLPDEPFNFVAFADSQSNFDIFGQIAELMRAEDPWVAISSGDTVGTGWTPSDFDEQLFGPAADLWRSTPLYVAIGNHEGNSPAFFNSFHFPNDDRAYYSFTFGSVFFIALACDTARLYVPGTPQYRFFVDALSSDEAQEAEFRVVFFHTPPWTEGWEGYEGEPLVRWFLVPLMEQYGVDVYFNGHTHDYERGHRNGVTSYIIGGAAGGLDSWARDVPHIVFYEAVHHFVSVSVDDNEMTIDAINLDGELFDTYTITH